MQRKDGRTMKIVSVQTSKKYNVLIGKNLLNEAGKYIKDIIASDKILIVTDDNIEPLYSRALEESLLQAGFSVFKRVIRHGEGSKSIFELTNILNYLSENHFTRTDAILALGGGVTGDLSGFAAATYLRGVHFIQMPTTLLAAVDSSVGGKTGINLECGKNLAGAFYQPDGVLCDYETLSTLQDGVFAEGCAEVIKYSFIADNGLFPLIKSNVAEHIEEVIFKCVSIKRDIVSKDEYDTGERQLLNFGHTLGHAIEARSKFNISHGDAVAAGMAMITKAAVKMGYCPQSCYDELKSILQKYNLPSSCTYSAQELLEPALLDKKRANSEITLVLPQSIGKCSLYRTDIEKLEEIIKYSKE